MRIKLIAVGKSMPDWVNTGFQEYAKRLRSSITLELIEIPLAKRSKNADIARLMAREGEQMLQAVNSRHGSPETVIALDVQGKQWDTETLSTQLGKWRELSQDIALLIGGPEGLAPACLEKASMRWSLSALTLPHPLVRIVVAEQLYRAWSILSGHPYHRGETVRAKC